MPRFTPGQLVVLPGGVHAAVTYEATHGTVYVRKLDGTGRRGAAWFDQAQTRGEALRGALRLLTFIANDIEAAYKLLVLLDELSPWVEQAAVTCDRIDAELRVLA